MSDWDRRGASRTQLRLNVQFTVSVMQRDCCLVHGFDKLTYPSIALGVAIRTVRRGLGIVISLLFDQSYLLSSGRLACQRIIASQPPTLPAFLCFYSDFFAFQSAQLCRCLVSVLTCSNLCWVLGLHCQYLVCLCLPRDLVVDPARAPLRHRKVSLKPLIRYSIARLQRAWEEGRCLCLLPLRFLLSRYRSRWTLAARVYSPHCVRWTHCSSEV